MTGPGTGDPDKGREPDHEPVPEILRGGSPREILRRLAEGDPLRIEERCHDHLGELAILLDPFSLAARSLAQIAYSAAEGYDGSPSLEDWLLDQIEQSIDQLLDEERYAAEVGEPPDEEHPYYSLLAELAGVEPAIARRMCVVFNGLPDRMREGFFNIVIEEQSLEDCATQMGTTPQALMKEIEDTLELMLVQAQELDEGEPR